MASWSSAWAAQQNPVTKQQKAWGCSPVYCEGVMLNSQFCKNKKPLPHCKFVFWNKRMHNILEITVPDLNLSSASVYTRYLLTLQTSPQRLLCLEGGWIKAGLCSAVNSCVDELSAECQRRGEPAGKWVALKRAVLVSGFSLVSWLSWEAAAHCQGHFCLGPSQLWA